MNGALVGIVVVSWNGRSALEQALPTIEDSARRVPGPCQLVLVDNGSTDDSVRYVRERHPAWELVLNGENVGFSAAANQGIRRTSGRFVALVNNDVVCDPLWLVELLDALDQYPRAGSAGANLRYLHNAELVNAAGIDVDVIGRPRDRHDGLPVSAQGDQPELVFGASGGAVLYRRGMLEHIGLLDERFFAYLEDVDLAWRAQRAGWRALHVPTSVVLHEHSATASRVRGLKSFLSSRNLVWVLAKNASPAQLAVAIPSHALLSVWTALLALRRRDASALRGLLAGIRGIRPFLRERHGGYLRLSAFTGPRLFGYRAADRQRTVVTRPHVEPDSPATRPAPGPRAERQLDE